MCTVTFIPARGNVFITSNRDERNSRKAALPPAIYHYKGCNLIFPKDAVAGGTWIVLKENGDAAVLLNGAFICHASEPPYRRSRGLIFLDVLASGRPSWTFSKTDLSGIEPFTIILFEKRCLYEFRWDGAERYCKQLPPGRPHIWSSATLYDGLVIKKREYWFASFMNRYPQPTQLDILNFHQFSGDGDRKNGLLMEREGIYSTVSITSIQLNDDRGVMKYVDTKDNRSSEIKIGLLSEPELL
jgi:hypothetical protein